MNRGVKVAAVLSLAVLLHYWRAVFLGGVFYERDIYNYWRPHIDWALTSLAGRETIAWNPAMQFGMPFLADPNFQMFYPPTWSLLVLSPESFYTFLVVGHAILAGLGVARLLRSYGFEDGALSGGIAMALSGPFVSEANLWHHYCGAAWLPWMVWSVRRAEETEGMSWRPAAAIWALAALAGSAESVAMGVVLALITQGFRLTRPATLKALALAALVAGLIASIQWMPTWQALRTSARSQFSAREKLAWSLPVASTAHMFVAGPYARTRSPAAHEDTFVDDDLPLIATPYLGAFLLPFAALGASRARAFGVAGVVFAVGSLGRHLGPVIGQAIGLLPFRYPTKLLVGVSVAFAILVGAGVHRAIQERGNTSSRLSRLVLLTILGVTGAAGIQWGRPGVVWTALLAGLGAVAIWKASTVSVVVLGAIIDLGSANGWVNRYNAPAIFHFRPAVVDVVRKIVPRPRVLSVYPSEVWAQVELNRLGRGTPVMVAAAVTEFLAPPHGMTFGIRHAFQTEFSGLGVPEARDWETYRGSKFQDDLGRYMSLAAVSAVVSAGGLNPLGTDTPLALLPGVLPWPTRVDTWNHVPRAALAVRVHGVRDAADAMRLVASPAFQPGPDVALRDAGTATGAVFQGGEARLVRDENDHVEVEVNSNGPGLLVLRDTFREGWSATVNGNSVPIRQADVLFRAVEVPSGGSLVAFRYATPGLRMGAFLCSVGLLLLTLLGRVTVR